MSTPAAGWPSGCVTLPPTWALRFSRVTSGWSGWFGSNYALGGHDLEDRGVRGQAEGGDALAAGFRTGERVQLRAEDHDRRTGHGLAPKVRDAHTERAGGSQGQADVGDGPHLAVRLEAVHS